MRRTTSTALALLGALAMSTTLLATLDNQKAFVEKYPDAKAKLGKCSTCHVKPLPKKDDHESNAYGKDLAAKAVIDPKAEKKTYDFSKVEALDSDGDGVKNIDEIKAGTNPGAK
jgi:hypothetical protein